MDTSSDSCVRCAVVCESTVGIREIATHRIDNSRECRMLHYRRDKRATIQNLFIALDLFASFQNKCYSSE